MMLRELGVIGFLRSEKERGVEEWFCIQVDVTKNPKNKAEFHSNMLPSLTFLFCATEI